MSKILDPILEQKMDVIAEEIFGTESDPNQIPITQESGEKLDNLTSHWIKYKLDERGDPIAWVVVIPTTRELAKQFVDGDITEKDLLNLTKAQSAYSALYLCAAITLPAHRRKGLALQLFKEAIESISKTEDYILVAWPVRVGGAELAEMVAQKVGHEILIRE
ncbi:MAG: hypothetical protein AAB463_00050 [Patescibacteria group bacterium]